MIGIPHGWSNVIYHSSSQHPEKILLNGLIAGGIDRKEGRQDVTSRPHAQKSKAVLDQKSWQLQIVPYVHVAHRHDLLNGSWSKHQTWV